MIPLILSSAGCHVYYLSFVSTDLSNGNQRFTYFDRRNNRYSQYASTNELRTRRISFVLVDFYYWFVMDLKISIIWEICILLVLPIPLSKQLKYFVYFGEVVTNRCNNGAFTSKFIGGIPDDSY